MSDLRKAAEKYIRPGTIVDVDVETTAILVDLLRQALAKPEWVGLTDEERFKIARDTRPYVADTMRAHEEELKRRNT